MHSYCYQRLYEALHERGVIAGLCAFLAWIDGVAVIVACRRLLLQRVRWVSQTTPCDIDVWGLRSMHHLRSARLCFVSSASPLCAG